MSDIVDSMVRGFMATAGLGLLMLAGLIATVVYATFHLS